MCNKESKNGFTIVELVAVISVISILVLIAQASFFSMNHRAKISSLSTNHRVLIFGAGAYSAANDGAMPDTMDDILKHVITPDYDQLGPTGYMNGYPEGSTYKVYEFTDPITGSKYKVIESKLVYKNKPDYILMYELK